MMFLGKEHEQRFMECMRRDGTHSNDVERKALFYILSGNKDLWSKGIEKFYDFKGHGIKGTRGLNKLCLCNSSLALVELGFNLYNGYKRLDTVLDIFSCLDEDNKKLAFNALRVRFRFNA